MIYIKFLSPFSLEVLFETLCTQIQQLLTHNTKITDLEYTSLTDFICPHIAELSAVILLC